MAVFKDNAWPSVISALLVLNMGGIIYLATRVNTIDQKFDTKFDQIVVPLQQRVTKTETEIANIPSVYADKEWTRKNFVEKDGVKKLYDDGK
jgi:hypothetical protein